MDKWNFRISHAIWHSHDWDLAAASAFPLPWAPHSAQPTDLERHSVVGLCCQHKLQSLLDGLRRSMDPTQMAMGLTIICDFYGSLKTQNWPHLWLYWHHGPRSSRDPYQPNTQITQLPGSHPCPAPSWGPPLHTSNKPRLLRLMQGPYIPGETFSGRPQTLPWDTVFLELTSGV